MTKPPRNRSSMHSATGTHAVETMSLIESDWKNGNFKRWKAAKRRLTGDLQSNDNVMAYAVRKGHWKGVVAVCQDFTPSVEDEMELYDLSRDPFEETDVAKNHPGVVTHLKNLIVSEELSCSCFQCDWPAP